MITDSTSAYTNFGHSSARQVAGVAGLMAALLVRTQRGANLLNEGYAFLGNPLTNDTTHYTVVSPEADRYSVVFDTVNGVYSCSCPDCQYRHLPCKHLACIAQNKSVIDAEIAELRTWLNSPVEPVRTIHVKAHTRTLKSGRIVNVNAYSYTRRVVRKAVA